MLARLARRLPTGATVLCTVLAAAGCRSAGAAADDSTGHAAANTGASSAAPRSSTRAPAPTTSASTAATAPCAPQCSDIERCAAGRCEPHCPADQVFVPATGRAGFVMGANLRGHDVDPPHQVVLTRPFCMDRTEVTAGAYQSCVQAAQCEAPRLWGMWINYGHQPDHPINKVSWPQAKKYCESQRRSLPTEAQWEWAATGGDGRKWAWGNEPPSCQRADFTPAVLEGPSSDDGCSGGGTSAVGSHPRGDKIWPAGAIHDLSGNVWEWVLDNYGPLDGQDETDPLHLTAERGVHVVRGGGWNRSGRGIRTQYRGGAVVDYQVPGLGFRCVTNPAL